MCAASSSSCAVCEEAAAKYKCPQCRAPYCSIGCCRSHKEKGCQQSCQAKPENEAPEGSVPQNVTYSHVTEHTVPPERLVLLEHSEALKGVLKNSHLREVLHTIHQSQDPWNALKNAMQEPLFVEFADACLKVVDPQEEAEQLQDSDSDLMEHN